MSDNKMIARLERLAAHYDGIASSIRTTLDVLRNETQAVKLPTLGSVLDQALALDDARREKKVRKTRSDKGTTQRPKAKKPSTRAELLAQRQRTADFLAMFSDKPRVYTREQMSGMPLGKLIAVGYLKRHKDGGYTRTAKPYVVDTSSNANGNGAHA